MNPSAIPASQLTLLNLVPFAFLAILLLFVRPAKLKTIHEDYLSLQSTKNLQGFSMLCNNSFWERGGRETPSPYFIRPPTLLYFCE